MPKMFIGYLSVKRGIGADVKVGTFKIKKCVKQSHHYVKRHALVHKGYE